MKKDLKDKLINRKIKKPNPFLATVGLWVLGILNKSYKVKFSHDYNPKEIENQPTILLSTHSSRLEFIYAICGFKRKDVNIVCGYQNIMKKGVYYPMMKLGVISKYLYQQDFACVKNMLRVLKRNGSIALFPEGIQSTSGSTHPINPATAKFIKSSKANIVICTTEGAYLATNRYSADRKKGHIGVKYSLLFTPDQLKELTEEQVYNLILEKFRYNDFAFNKTARHKYQGKLPNADGIDKILYKCPDCKEENTLSVENDCVVCHSCGFKVRINEYYDLIKVNGNVIPQDIDKWFKWQRKVVAKEILSDDFSMTLTGQLCTLKTDKLRKPPKNRQVLSVGKATLTNRRLTFTGTIEGQEKEYVFDAESLYSLTYSTKGFLEFYYENDYFMLIAEKRDDCLIKWTLAVEEIHNLYDVKWKRACQDVYEYDQEDFN